MENFKFWKKSEENGEWNKFNKATDGLLWLKIKSITRSGLIDGFIKENKLEITTTGLGNKFVELYNLLSENCKQAHSLINGYISTKSSEQLKNLKVDNLISELYKVDTFKWGADNQNDLGKYLIKKYVKDNASYDFLISSIDSSVMKTVQDYLVCTWYNHWTSILIEFLFKKHNVVLPTVGKIKSVDFFINEIPFDLKVTYLPINFIEEHRKLSGLKKEEIFLKNVAKKLNIKFKSDDANLYYSLIERLKDNGTKPALKALQDIKNFRIGLINKVKKDPLLLAKNLYENQSAFRFGAENRIFLVLVDTNNFGESWKLKRNSELLKPSIDNYLASFKNKSIKDLELSFYKEGNQQQNPKEYKVLTDVLIIKK